jgi:acetyl-CoA C-acetyltransferase
MSGLGGKVAIIGTGTIKFGENFHQSLTDMVLSSGIRMINNVHDQLLGRAGKRQVQGADVGLTHNLGGPGSVSAVAVLSQP